jgi:hypothetical protein
LIRPVGQSAKALGRALLLADHGRLEHPGTMVPELAHNT